MERTILDTGNDCLNWTGRLSFKKGRSDYLPIMKTVYTKGVWLSVTRYTWGLMFPELSKSDRLRNKCGNLRCINPYHYDCISKVCPSGHERTPENLLLIESLWVDVKGEPQISLVKHCRPCKRLDLANRRKAKKEARAVN